MHQVTMSWLGSRRSASKAYYRLVVDEQVFLATLTPLPEEHAQGSSVVSLKEVGGSPRSELLVPCKEALTRAGA